MFRLTPFSKFLLTSRPSSRSLVTFPNDLLRCNEFGWGTLAMRSSSSSSSSSQMKPKFVIVGGVAGGATAAARLRRLAEDAEIIMLEKGPDVSFANCGLPYHIGGEIKDRGALLLHTPDSLGKLLKIDVRTHHEVVKIDRANNQVIVQKTDPFTGKVERFPLSYDRLLISTGASPLRPKIPGIDKVKNVFSLRSLQDMDQIVNRVKSMKAQNGPMKATVIGAGFIGLEMVEALMHQGVQVTLIEARDQVLPQMDADMTRLLYQELISRGIEVILSDKVISFAPDSSAEDVAISLESGKLIDKNQVVILSIGVRPDSQLAGEAGLKLHPQTNAILVNEFLQTTDQHIYAVGDVTQTRSRWSQNVEDPTNWVPLAGPANRQARLAAENMLTTLSPSDQQQQNTLRAYHGSLGTSIVRFGDSVAAVTGYTEAALKRINKNDYASVVVSGYSHASYYPGALPLYLKVTYDTKTKKILGAQACGGDGVDKRIDILATAIAGDFTIDKLEHLELCYSPCFGSARDIVNTAGFLSYNIDKGLVKTVTQLPSGNDQQLIDVRPAIVSELHPVKGAINIPFEQLRSRLNELDPKLPITAACAFGKTSYFAARVLSQSGFPSVSSLMGGLGLRAPVLSNTSNQSQPRAPSITTTNNNNNTFAATTVPLEIELDCCGLACPGPVMKIRTSLSNLQPGQVVRVLASDSGFGNDFEPFCKSVGVEFLGLTKSKGIFTGKFRVPGGARGSTNATLCSSHSSESVAKDPNNKDVAIVLFSGDLDKALAALVIANGAIALGGRATVFCTFWGLNALRQEHAVPTKKPLLDRMMAMMMPRGIGKLKLSQMNMGGMGTAMMKYTMAAKHLPNLPGLLKDGLASGQLDLVACGMSMEALGIQKEELIPCEVGGVAQFLSVAQKSANTLFI